MQVSELISEDEAKEYKLLRALFPEEDHGRLEIWFCHEKLPVVKVAATLVNRRSMRVWSHSTKVDAVNDTFVTTTGADTEFEAATLAFIENFMIIR